MSCESLQDYITVIPRSLLHLVSKPLTHYVGSRYAAGANGFVEMVFNGQKFRVDWQTPVGTAYEMRDQYEREIMKAIDRVNRMLEPVVAELTKERFEHDA